MAAVGGYKGVEKVLKNIRGHALYACNRIVSSVEDDITPEVLKNPALDKLWEEARKDK